MSLSLLDEGMQDLFSSIIATDELWAKKENARKRRNLKRRCNNPAFIPEIRIFRRDIRRKYGQIFTNILNHHDLNLLKQFLNEFSVPHAKASNQYPDHLLLKLYHPPNAVALYQLVNIFTLDFLIMPDIVFSLSDVRVCQRWNEEGSRIIGKTSMKGTIIYSILDDHINNNHTEKKEEEEEIQKNLRTSLVLSSSSLPKDFITQQNIMWKLIKANDAELLQCPTPRLQLRPDPCEYTVNGILTMTLNKDRRIISTHLDIYETKERYLNKESC